MCQKKSDNSPKKWLHRWESVSIVLLLLFLALLIIIPQNFQISSAKDSSRSTEKVYSDFINGTYDHVQVLETCKGNELRLDMYEDCTWLNVTPLLRPGARWSNMMAADRKSVV